MNGADAATHQVHAASLARLRMMLANDQDLDDLPPEHVARLVEMMEAMHADMQRSMQRLFDFALSVKKSGET